MLNELFKISLKINGVRTLFHFVTVGKQPPVMQKEEFMRWNESNEWFCVESRNPSRLSLSCHVYLTWCWMWLPPYVFIPLWKMKPELQSKPHWHCRETLQEGSTAKRLLCGGLLTLTRAWSKSSRGIQSTTNNFQDGQVRTDEKQYCCCLSLRTADCYPIRLA